MKQYGGLAFYFAEPEHRGTVLRRIKQGHYFTENVSSRDLKPESAEISLFSFDGKTISHICLARSTRMTVTARMTLKFSGYVDLGGINVAGLEHLPELKNFIGQLFSKPVTRVDGADWNALLAAIKRLRPALANQIEVIEKNRLLVGKTNDSSGVAIVAQERDATRMALEFFGLDKEEIRQTLEFDLPLEPAPFLRGVRAVKLLEDPMIGHDARSLPGFSEIKPYAQGSVEFTKETERITILNVNRAGVEKAVGVDLIYYAHTFKSYVMVQYKRLHQVVSDWEFNLNEPQFLIDLDRMGIFNKKCPAPQFSGDPLSYRLNAQQFYFKFCKDVSFEPLDSGMIEGMYLPEEYLRCLMESPHVKGKRGGRAIGYKNVLHHFNNTQFTNLVRGGWIGSRTNATDIITDLIRVCIEADHSVIVGLSSKEPGEK
jgi:hypothetical protein